MDCSTFLSTIHIRSCHRGSLRPSSFHVESREPQLKQRVGEGLAGNILAIHERTVYQASNTYTNLPYRTVSCQSVRNTSSLQHSRPGPTRMVSLFAFFAGLRTHVVSRPRHRVQKPIYSYKIVMTILWVYGNIRCPVPDPRNPPVLARGTCHGICRRAPTGREDLRDLTRSAIWGLLICLPSSFLNVSARRVPANAVLP